ncbi:MULTISPECIES: hypothetical protein [Arthrobacter]|uniref:Uncharacterized protein n=1 Tax=Arthrobacter terricola TaxID=2547396 RepID=A0A4R5K999_9MICC|nr:MULTISPECIES: hypothetical protein [Arthrobacter]MBT8163306.1 hypothetical protein [Arthrobacter sp. GN70]TDF90998.1 hypothetical protein E1809_21920 [Arthrobacter terricola]
MEYLGLFLILVAAGLRLMGRYFAGADHQPRSTATFRGLHAVPPGAAALLAAAAGVFIFTTSISTR